jgi:hypothetical protein
LAGSLSPSCLFAGVRLLVLRQMRLLSETFSTQLARERLLSGVRAHVNVHTVLVLEALVANVAVMQETGLLFLAPLLSVDGTS